ncbi:hypothetical protein AHAS_Ahas02G0203400 [Arachis hypogaea]
MAPKSTAMKMLWAIRKNVVAWSIQFKETGETSNLSSPSKSDSGTSAFQKVILGPMSRPTLSPSSSAKPATRPPPSTSEPNPKKMQDFEVESIYEQGFDSLSWSEKHILRHSYISMDDVAIRSHLQLLARDRIRTAGICVTLA